MYDARACIAYAMSAVHVLLFRLYPDFILILYKFYPDFILKIKLEKNTLSKFYPDFIQILTAGFDH